MKRLSPFIIFLLIGCAGFEIGDDQTTEVLVRMAAIEVGCQVATDNATELDRALRNVYEFAKTGTIPQDALDLLNTELGKAFDERPTLGLQLTNLATLIGIQFDPGGGVIGLGDIPPNILAAVAGGYDGGFKACQN